jgi:hypothetical protein
VAKLTPTGTVVTKAHPDSPPRIDCAVAAVIAHERAAWHAANCSREPLFAWVEPGATFTCEALTEDV